jgi:catechol 2,3-dioxygenase-like lactoylglutathione lyase family enzyme
VRVRRIAWLGTRTEKPDETAAFFRDVLGIPLVYEETGFSMLQLPSGERDFVEIFAPSHPGGALYTTGPVVGLLVDDVDEARAELAAAGVEALDETHWPDELDGYGWFHVRGPDGSVYAILQDSRDSGR